MKIRIFVLCLLAMFVATFTACGDGDSEGSESTMCVPAEPEMRASSSVSELGQDHHMVYTEIVIDRSPQEVWETLTDFESMPDWSSSFQGLSGDIRDGGQVVATFIVQNPSTGETGPAEFPHTLKYEEGVSFGWSDPIAGFDGLTDNHVYMLEEISPCQTRFVQTDTFQGTNDAFTTEGLATVSEQFYNAFNQELRTEVESKP